MYLLNKVIQINFIWITFEEEIVLNSTKDMLEEISYSPTLCQYSKNLVFEINIKTFSTFCTQNNLLELTVMHITIAISVM